MFFRRFSILILCIFLFSLIFSNYSYAISVSIDKPRLKIVSPPGSTKSEVISVFNKGNDTVEVETKLLDWFYDKDGNVVFRPPGTLKLSCAEWIDISPKMLTIPPGENRQFSITLRVPDDAIGGHNAIIFFKSAPIKDKEADIKGSSIRIVGEIGSAIYHEVEGRVNKIASIKSFNVSKPGRNKPLEVKYQIKNEGNASIKFKGIVSIVGKDGAMYGTAESQKEKGTLPGDLRDDAIKWFGSIPKGEYSVILTVDMGEDVPPIVEEKTIKIEKDIL